MFPGTIAALEVAVLDDGAYTGAWVLPDDDVTVVVADGAASRD